MEAQVIERTPLGRSGAPDDVAKIAVFLASDAPAFVTGERIMSRADGAEAANKENEWRHKMSEAIEVTTFKFNGKSGAEFIAAQPDNDEWLERQRGFISRRIAERDEFVRRMQPWDSVLPISSG